MLKPEVNMTNDKTELEQKSACPCHQHNDGMCMGLCLLNEQQKEFALSQLTIDVEEVECSSEVKSDLSM